VGFVVDELTLRWVLFPCLFGFLLLRTIPSLLQPYLSCAVGMTRQHIITFSVCTLRLYLPPELCCLQSQQVDLLSSSIETEYDNLLRIISHVLHCGTLCITI
jgi:hypothetical protein